MYTYTCVELGTRLLPLVDLLIHTQLEHTGANMPNLRDNQDCEADHLLGLTGTTTYRQVASGLSGLATESTESPASKKVWSPLRQTCTALYMSAICQLGSPRKPSRSQDVHARVVLYVVRSDTVSMSNERCLVFPY